MTYEVLLGGEVVTKEQNEIVAEDHGTGSGAALRHAAEMGYDQIVAELLAANVNVYQARRPPQRPRGRVLWVWAFAGGGASIIRVEVSADGGKTWILATASDVEEDHTRAWKQTWAWTLWEATIPVIKGKKEYELQVRALDDMYNVQPVDPPQVGTYNWNRSGYLNNSYFGTKFTVHE